MATTLIETTGGSGAITGTPDYFNHTTATALRIANVTYSGSDKTFWRRTILRWDLASVAALTLTDATLTRYINLLWGGGGHTMLFSRVLDPDTVGGDPDWIDQDHSESDPWDDAGGDFDAVGPPPGLSITEPTALGQHIITDAGLLTLVQDAIDNRSNLLMLLVYLSDEDPSVNTGTRWATSTLTLTSPDPQPEVTPTAHRDIVVSHDRVSRPRPAYLPRRGRRPAKPRRPRS